MKLRDKWIQFRFNCFLLWRTYILKLEDCDNCKWFGGCCCDHLDENGECMGWEQANFNPIPYFKRRYQMWKIKREIRKRNFDFYKNS